ncbi:MAG: hypothetical protein Q6373_021750 [Candidatus Sigynarchaeota archaeon]
MAVPVSRHCPLIFSNSTFSLAAAGMGARARFLESAPREKKTFPHEPISRRPIPALANARQRLDPQAVDPILKQVALQHLNYLEGTYYEKREF